MYKTSIETTIDNRPTYRDGDGTSVAHDEVKVWPSLSLKALSSILIKGMHLSPICFIWQLLVKAFCLYIAKYCILRLSEKDDKWALEW